MVSVKGAGWLVTALLAVAVTGCSVGRGPLVVGSDDPAVNVPAMVKAGETDDRSKMAALVDQLESTDPAVRMFAIRSLRDLAGGETFGYRYFDSEMVRASSVLRWREYVSSLGGKSPATRTSTTLPVAWAGGNEGDGGGRQ